MEFDEINLRPTYRLLVGVPGTSSGIEIARRLGLPERVVARAQSQLTPESREARGFIAYLHRSRDEVDQLKRETRSELAQLDNERRSLQTEWVDRQKKRISELEKSFLETQKRLEAEVTRLVEDVKDRGVRAQLEKQSSRRLGKLASDARAEADAAVVETLATSQQDLGVIPTDVPRGVEPSLLSSGDKITVKGYKQALTFRRHDGRQAEVEAGVLRMKVPLGDILSIDAKFGAEFGGKSGMPRNSEPSPARTRGITVRSQPSESGSEEINVIGCTVEEATRRVDKFLDEAALAGKSSVRIIHGYGTGALKRGLGEFLTTHPLVEAIHPEVEERGGNAVTVAELNS
jgi:DNA mismatch repair protein MutS2